MDVVDSSVLAEEEVILWVTSDLCSSTAVTSAPVDGTIPVTLYSSGDGLIEESVEPVQFTDGKASFFVTNEDVPDPKGKKTRKRGIVWNYFVPTIDDRASCNFCSTEISYKGKSTNNLLRHLRTKHSDICTIGGGDTSELVERKLESCIAEDGSTYYLLSAPVKSPSPTPSHSSFQPEDDPAKSVKRRGGVWKYYLTDAKQRAKCKFCSAIISYKGGSTTNLLRHMKSKHPTVRMHKNRPAGDGVESMVEPNSSSIQHTFAEIVNECVKSDEEGEFHVDTGFHFGESSKSADPKSNLENITILSSMDPNFSQGIEMQYSDATEFNEPCKERRKSAVAWKYFTMQNDERAQCATCNALISFKGGSTGNLLRHLKTRHADIDLTPPVKVEEVDFSDEDDLDEQPAFEAIENKELAKFVQLLNPTYKLQGASVPRLGDREFPKRLRKRGSAFSYFEITENNESGCCQLCGATVALKRGSKAPLLRHLKAKHPETDTMLVSVNGSSDEAGSSSQFVNVEDIENVPVDANDPPTKEKATKKMRKRGLVWNHFVPLEDEKAKCNICPAVISYKRGSTSNLLRHMKKKHTEVDVQDEDPLKMDILNELSGGEEEEIAPEDDPSRKVLRKRGRVWNYFKPTQPDKAKCTLCNVVVVYLKGSTTNLLRHMKKRHADIDLLKEKPFNKVLTYPREKSSNTVLHRVVPSNGGDGGGGGSVDSGEEHVSVTSASAKPGSSSSSSDKGNAIYRRSEIIFRKHFDTFLNRPVSVTRSKLYDEQLAKMIVKQYCPFTIVECDDFRNFVQTVNPGYSLPSRKTISSRLIPDLYEKSVKEVRERLSAIKYVTLTMNKWMLLNSERYISITAHFIDEECQLRSYFLDCFRYEDDHRAEDLSATIETVLTDWMVLEKVCAFVTENTAPVVAAVDLLAGQRIACFADMINSVVLSGLAEMSGLLERVKSITEFFKNNQLALKKLSSALKETDVTDAKLKPYDPKIWTSIYETFNQMISFRKGIDEVLETFVEGVHALNEFEWTLLERTCSILKPLHDITDEVCEKNVTVSKVIPLSKCIANYLQKTLLDSLQGEELVAFVNKMLQEVTLKFDRIEDNIPLAEATFLDPRFKNQAFNSDQSYSNVYHSLLQQASVVQLGADADGGKTQPAGVSEANPEAAAAATTTAERNIWDEFDSRVVHLNDSQNPETAAAVELENYLQEVLISRSGDPLVWWRERKSVYPRLFDTMKRKLCIAATAVSKDYTSSGQLVCEKRNKLSSSKVSMVLFLNHNL